MRHRAIILSFHLGDYLIYQLLINNLKIQTIKKPHGYVFKRTQKTAQTLRLYGMN